MNADSSNIENIRNLALCEIIDRFVRSDPIFIETAGFSLGFENRYFVAEGRKLVRTGKPGGTCTHDSDAPSRQ